MLVKISDKQAADLKAYSNLSGVSIEKLLYEACSDYIECVISSRTEAIERKIGVGVGRATHSPTPPTIQRSTKRKTKANLFEVVRMMEENEKQSARKADLLFGTDKETCTDEERKIISDPSLTFDEQMAKLQVLRGEKAVKPKSFRKRISTTDAIHAKALGIKLD